MKDQEPRDGAGAEDGAEGGSGSQSLGTQSWPWWRWRDDLLNTCGRERTALPFLPLCLCASVAFRSASNGAFVAFLEG